MRSMKETAIRSVVGDMFAAEWIYNPTQAAGRDGATRPSNQRLLAARDLILERDDVFTPEQQAAAAAWRLPQLIKWKTIAQARAYKAAAQARASKAARAAKGFAKIEAVRHLSLLMDSHERAAKLVPLIENEPPEIFWPIFLSEWTICDAAWEWQQKLIPILRRVGPCPREIYLEHARDNGQFWSSLPDDLTLYRGCSRAHVNAISWTANRSIAEGFAKGHRFIRVPDAVIATATIRKADIFAATDDRKESEIICLPRVVGIENWTISRVNPRLKKAPC